MERNAANFAPLYDVDTFAWTDELTDDIIERAKLP